MDFLTKVAVKQGTIRTLGVKLDDMKDEAERLVSEFTGGVRSLAHAAKMVVQLHGNIDHEFDEGKIKEGMTSNEVRKLLKKYVERCQGVVINLAEQAEAMKQQAFGKSIALKNAIEFSKKMHEEEDVKAKNFSLAEEGGVVDARTGKARRAIGRHPGGSIKDQRAGLKVVEPEEAPTEDNKEESQDALEEKEEVVKADTPTIDVPVTKLVEISEKDDAKEDGANGETVS